MFNFSSGLIAKFEKITFLGINFEVYHYIIKTYLAKFTSHSRFEISSVDRGLTVIQFD